MADGIFGSFKRYVFPLFTLNGKSCILPLCWGRPGDIIFVFTRRSILHCLRTKKKTSKNLFCPKALFCLNHCCPGYKITYTTIASCKQPLMSNPVQYTKKDKMQLVMVRI